MATVKTVNFQNNIDELETLEDFRYENLFLVNKVDDYYFYNIIKSIQIPDDLDESLFKRWRVDRPMPWTTISHKHYNTIHLWWLICVTNKIQNPVFFPETGTELKILTKSAMRNVLLDVIKQIRNRG